uniref:Uncharacterized protein n=1 Tax=Photinus pyralis TaxID=7054 RepID=A0A1Y1M231_PHOPY
MVSFRLLLVLFCFRVIDAQLEGGLLGLLKPDGVQISLPGLLGLTDKRKSTTATTTTTSTTTTTTTPAPLTQASVTSKKPTGPAAACGYTPTFVNGKRSCRGKLIFQDGFSKLAGKWFTENRFAGEPDYEFTIYQGNAENLYLNKNKLHIRPTLTDDKYGNGFVTGDRELNLGDTCTGRPATEDCVQRPRAWMIVPPTISSMISTKKTFLFPLRYCRNSSSTPERRLDISTVVPEAQKRILWRRLRVGPNQNSARGW